MPGQVHPLRGERGTGRGLAPDRTVADAQAGVPRALTHLGPGCLSRVNDLEAARWGQYAEAVALVGPTAFLSQDAVLSLHRSLW